MSYNGSGTFQINTTGQPVVIGTVISATAFNALTADLATGLSTAITKDGQTATTARIPFAQGITSTLTTDATSTASGSIITSGGVGIAKALYVGTTSNLAGSVIFGSTIVYGGVTLSASVTGTGKMVLDTSPTLAGTITTSGLNASSAVATDSSKALVSVTNTGTGNNVLATSPTLITPILGTPTSATLTNATGLPLTTGVTGVLPEANGGTGSSAGNQMFKNRLINSAMVIDQRNAGASVTPTDGQYVLDRWLFGLSQASKYTVQQNAGAVTPPAGFTNYLGVTVGASANVTLAAGDNFNIRHFIEGYNVADLGWGTANAQTITLSFWVRSSLTGTFGGALSNSNVTRSYPFTYTISVANTWEQKTITIAGDTGGSTTWVTTTGIGLRLWLNLGAGSTYTGTAGAWAAADYRSATGAVNPITTNSATFYITGVQLEKGSTATSFDYRPYGTELALCQRYYQNSYDIGTAPATATTIGMRTLGYAIATSTTGYGAVFFQIPMRSAPTIAIYDGAGTVSNVSTVPSGSTTFTNGRAQAAVPFNISTNTFVHQGQATVASVLNFIHFTASAEL